MSTYKNKKSVFTLYVISCLLTVLITIGSDVVQVKTQIIYSRNFEIPILSFAMVILAPIVISFILFVKINLQRRIPVWHSRIINTISTVIFCFGIDVVYQPLNFMTFIFDYPATVLVLCLHLCSLVYDFTKNRHHTLVP